MPTYEKKLWIRQVERKQIVYEIWSASSNIATYVTKDGKCVHEFAVDKPAQKDIEEFRLLTDAERSIFTNLHPALLTGSDDD